MYFSTGYLFYIVVYIDVDWEMVEMLGTESKKIFTMHYTVINNIYF